jgi:hypothetical protein
MKAYVRVMFHNEEDTVTEAVIREGRNIRISDLIF